MGEERVAERVEVEEGREKANTRRKKAGEGSSKEEEEVMDEGVSKQRDEAFRRKGRGKE